MPTYVPRRGSSPPPGRPERASQDSLGQQQTPRYVPPSAPPPAGLNNDEKDLLGASSYRQLTELVQFLNSHHGLYQRDRSGAFLTEATAALRRGEEGYAKNCVEKATVLQNCYRSRQKSADALREYYRRLLHQQQDGKYDESLAKAVRTALDECRKVAEKTPRHKNQADDVTQQLEKISISSQDYALSSGERTWDKSRKPSQPPRTAPTQDQAPQHQTRRHDSHHSATAPRVSAPAATVGGSPPYVRADYPPRVEFEKQKDKVHEDFVRRDARKAGDFFHVGRVFAIFWHEAEGDRRVDQGTLTDVWVTTNDLKQRIYTHKRIFIVVRENHGFCVAVPVHTYQLQGLLKPGLRQSHYDAHAIAYTKGTKPATLQYKSRSEPAMRKQPIEVDPGNYGKGHPLHKASRIDFSKPFAIEHNVRALNMGKVSEASMMRLSAYYAEHL